MQGSEACDTFITKHVMEKTLSYDFWEREISTINKLLAEMCGFHVIFFRVFLQSLLPPFFLSLLLFCLLLLHFGVVLGSRQDFVSYLATELVCCLGMEK